MRRSLILTLALACVLVLAAPAFGASSQTIINDCQDNGVVDGKYTQAELRKALKDLPSDVDQYTDCRGAIERAQLSRAGGGTGGPGGGGAGGIGGGGSGPGGTGGPTGAAVNPLNPLATATPAERKAFYRAVAKGGAPVKLDGGPAVTPGASGIRRVGGAGHELPASTLVLLGLAAAALLAGGGTATWTRVRARGAG